MNPASNAVPQSGKRGPWSNRRVLLIVGVVVGLIGVLAAVPLVKRLSLDYEFAFPATWSEECLGGGDAVGGLLDWDDPGTPRPDIRDSGATWAEYKCEWEWRPADGTGDGQLLTLTVEVRESRAYEPVDTSVENSLEPIEWGVDYESLDGWEHGICRESIADTASASYECIASESNLRLTISNRDLPGGEGHEDKYFGPGEVSVEDLTVEIGALVREAFRA
ncbi:hypothetical protein [Glycomyces harbinensis]|uniref:Uncharacterized protein n=1 Tax=Glycomyces harbinensis TaxID=58114 RepID=A0A1G6V4I3_9ACTN|nr:hypothetical protein [Glycomyces harbinensis]SDD48381.1 hypothetical protein SAMN05216270_104194 [Glycomyces harbinensis]